MGVRVYKALNDFYGGSAAWSWLDEETSFYKLIKAMRKVDGICTSEEECRKLYKKPMTNVEIEDLSKFRKFMMKYGGKFIEKEDVDASSDYSL